MKFDVGQAVTVANPSTPYAENFRGAQGVVRMMDPGQEFPYEVELPSGRRLGFAESELTAAFTRSPEAAEGNEINHPTHYTWMPNGVEVIDITEHFPFCLGNALKYIMRAGHKHDEPLTDLRKAVWYINREIERLEKGANSEADK